jgi:hypothetical protein
MNLRIAVALIAMSPVVPASAGEILKPEQARQFVAGKYFSYNCFEGSSGTGRIQADGSVAGTIRVRGQGQARYVSLPAGTIRVKPTAICASVRGVPMEPCFNIEQLDGNSFRGSIAGLGFAYCTFARRNPRLQVAQMGEPLSLRTTGSIRHARPVKSAEMSAPAVPVEKSDLLELRPSTSE